MKDLRFFLRAFYAHSFFKELVLLYPVYLLLFESKGMSVSQISLMLMIWSVSVVVLEIPSGVLADRFSRRTFIIIGTVFKLLGFALWLFADSFAMFAAGLVLWGVQEAMSSGCTEALLFDVLKKHGQDEHYEKYAGRARFYAGVALAISMLTGGFVADISFELAGIASVAAVALSAIAACYLDDVRAHRAQTKHAWRDYGQTLKDGLATCMKNRGVLAVLLFCALVVVVPGVLEEYDQLYAADIGLSLGFVGVWGALRTGLESLGSHVAYRVKGVLSGMGRICLLAAVSGLLLLAAVWGYSIAWLPAYALFYAVLSCTYVLAESMLQRRVDSAHRATVLSVNSLLINVMGFVLYAVFAGASSGESGLRTGFIVMAIYMIAAALALMIGGLFIRRKNGQAVVKIKIEE